MTLTPEQARERATAELRSDWKGSGTFYVAPVTLGDARDYVISAGAREWFVDEDPQFIQIDDVFFFMSRATGELRTASMSNDADLAQLEDCDEL